MISVSGPCMTASLHQSVYVDRMKQRILLEIIGGAALDLLLPPLRAAHAFTGEALVKLAALNTGPSGKTRWTHIPKPRLALLSRLEMYLASHGLGRAPQMPDGQCVCKINDSSPARADGNLADYGWYRRTMERLGTKVPLVEPPRELAPVSTQILDCRFSFEMPDAFAAIPEIERGAFEVEMHTDTPQGDIESN